MSTTGAYPTLAHAMAALDEIPILGSAQIRPDQLGVDFDALGRLRKVIAAVWRDDVPPVEISITMGAGLQVTWARSKWEMQIIVDPFALYAFRVDSPFGVAEWNRPSPEATIADAKATLAVMAQEGGAQLPSFVQPATAG
jgi:hypothetical protein